VNLSLLAEAAAASVAAMMAAAASVSRMFVRRMLPPYV